MAEFRELLALVSSSDLVDILKLMLDPQEFLSGYGIRSISTYRQAHPYVLSAQYGDYSVYYGPGESALPHFPCYENQSTQPLWGRSPSRVDSEQ